MNDLEFLRQYDARNKGVSRGVAQQAPILEDVNALTRKKAATEDSFESTGLEVPVVETLNFLTFIVLNTTNTVAIYEAMLNFLERQEFKNHQAFPDTKSILGYHFEESRCGLYQIQLLEHKDELVMACNRLLGDAVAVDAFWTKMQKAMQEDGLYDDPLGFPDEEFSFFSEEEEDDDLLLDFEDVDFRFLDFTQDPNYVLKLIRDIEDPNFDEHALLILAWNSQRESNMQCISENSQDLVDGIMACLKTHQDRLPVARCSALLLSKLVQAGVNFTIYWEQFELILNTLACWALGEHARKSELTQISTSQEISFFLSVILPQVGSMMSGTPPDSCVETFECLQRVVDDTKFEGVAENVSNFLETAVLVH